MKRVLLTLMLLSLMWVAGCGGDSETKTREHVFVTNGRDSVTPSTPSAQGVREYSQNPSTGALTLLALFGTTAASPGSIPRDVALVPFGLTSTSFLYVAYQGLTGKNVDAFDVSPSGDVFSAAGTVASGGAGARGIALHPSKKFLYVSNFTSNNISAFAIGANGALTLIPAAAGFMNPQPLNAGFTGPAGIAVHPNGTRLYIAEEGGGGGASGIEIRVINPATGLIANAPPAPTNVGSPGDTPDRVAVGPAGCLYEAGDLNQINSWALNGAGDIVPPAATTVIGGAGVAVAEGLALDNTNSLLFVALSQTTAGAPVAGGAGLAVLTTNPAAASCAPTLVALNQPAGRAPQNVTVDPLNKFVDVTSNIEEATGGGRSAISVFALGAGGVLTPVPGSPFDGGPAGPPAAGTNQDGGGADGIAIQIGSFSTP